MIYSVLHGDLVAALHYNALAMIALFLLAAWYVGNWLIRVRSPSHTREPVDAGWAPKVLLCVVFLWFVVRNVPGDPWTGLRP